MRQCGILLTQLLRKQCNMESWTIVSSKSSAFDSGGDCDFGASISKIHANRDRYAIERGSGSKLEAGKQTAVAGGNAVRLASRPMGDSVMDDHNTQKNW
jgi:hypothetical protein